MKLFINHDNQKIFVSDIYGDDMFRVRDVSILFGIKIEVSNKFIIIPCRYTPKKDIWFSCELSMEEAVCGTN